MLLWMARIPIRIGFHNARLRFLYHQTRPRPAAEHEVIRNLALLHTEAPAASFDDALRLYAPKSQELSEALKKQLPEAGSYAVLVPGSVWPTKRWYWKCYRSVAQHLIDRKIPVVLLGGSADKGVNQKVSKDLAVNDLAGRTRIDEAMTVVKHARLVICNDSMALHLASGFSVPTVAVFCSTIPEFGFTPWRNRAAVLGKDDLACRPCGRHGALKCPLGTDACMKELPAEDVIKASKALLDN